MVNFKKMFEKIAPGMCRLSPNGIAIKVGDEYKSYDVNTGRLTNCADFVFDVGDDMFFAIPCNSVVKGDIILTQSGPATVIEAKENEIRAFSYREGTIITIVPEHYVFFGNTYFYSKIISMFGDGHNMDLNKMLPFMMMSEVSKDKSGSDFSKMLPMLMMMNSGFKFDFNDMFGGVLNPTSVSDTCSCGGDCKNCHNEEGKN